MLIDEDNPENQPFNRKRKTNMKTSLPSQKYKVQNGIELKIKHCFAMPTISAKTPIQVIYDDQLLYIVGHYIVLHDRLLCHDQNYIELEPGFTSVTYMASTILPEKKALLAYSDNVSEISKRCTPQLPTKGFLSSRIKRKVVKMEV